ncbi:MAG TPA: DUF4837 family protein, partial [Candidatus Marinimicrobia bacterium]|nr:DUF4837 family protein [Candidatus Neomarinimicrobiota bacterium]
LILSFLFIQGCGDYKKLATGRDELIMTIAPDTLWSLVSGSLRNLVETEIRTPQFEKLYALKHIELNQFKAYRYSKNILLMATLDKNDPVSVYVRSLLPANGLELVKNKEQYLFPSPDHIAKRQFFTIYVTPTAEDMQEHILSDDGEKLPELLEEAFENRMMEQIYYKAEETEIAKHLMNKYGFSLRLQNNYIILVEDPKQQVVHLGKGNPNRWITIFWQEGGFKSVLSQEWAWQTRYWIGRRLMDNTTIEKKFVTSRTVDWEGKIVHNIRGLWSHPEKAMGGPFSSFYFYDGVTDRVYFIDLTIWAPGETKNVYLRQMEFMASTFSSRPIDKKYQSLERGRQK